MGGCIELQDMHSGQLTKQRVVSNKWLSLDGCVQRRPSSVVKSDSSEEPKPEENAAPDARRALLKLLCTSDVHQMWIILQQKMWSGCLGCRPK